MPKQFPIDDLWATRRLNRDLKRYLDTVKPDIVVLCNWYDAFPDALKHQPFVVIDAHNIESTLRQRVRKSRGQYRGLHLLRNAQWRRQERKLFRSASEIWATSVEDVAEIAEMCPTLKSAKLIPNAIDVASYADVRAFRRNRDGVAGPTLAYIGNYEYEPNVDAAKDLIRVVFPAFKMMWPEARLLLIGKGPTSEMRAAADGDSSIEIIGMVDDLAPYLRIIDVATIPLREGGGTRLKILEAFACMIPVVTTQKGAEGLDCRNGDEITICDDMTRFADVISTLCSDTSRLERQIRLALQLVETRYSWEAVVPLIRQTLVRAKVTVDS